MSRKYEVTVRVEATFTKTIEAEDYDDLNAQLDELADPGSVDSFDIDWFDDAELEHVYGGPEGEEYSPGEKEGAFEEDEEEDESEETPTAE